MTAFEPSNPATNPLRKTGEGKAGAVPAFPVFRLAPRKKNARRVARSLGVEALAFGSFVSLLILFTEDRLSAIDYLLLVGAPPLLGVLFYLVGLNHDPDASD